MQVEKLEYLGKMLPDALLATVGKAANPGAGLNFLDIDWLYPHERKEDFRVSTMCTDI